MEKWNIESLMKMGFECLPEDYIGMVMKKAMNGYTIKYYKWVKEATPLNSTVHIMDNNIWDWNHNFYFIESESTVLMTHRQLAEWLARGNGQLKSKDGYVCYTNYSYHEDVDNDNNGMNALLIRKWGQDTWMRPTLDMYFSDCEYDKEAN